MSTYINKELQLRRLLLFSLDPATLRSLISATSKYEHQAKILTIPNHVETDWYTFAIESNSDIIILDMDELTYVYDEFVKQIKLLKNKNKEIIILSADVYNSLLAIESLAFYFILKPINGNLKKIDHAITKGFGNLSELENM